ncbi:maleylacetoacetate isomerase [Pseudohongiella spirulinae]|uniref:Maleylacetoacetate isomerase n=1 Tax=Pseudohongiella spirulinae TaxID=1249552 RepID=A0A0S2KH89_9GAMM|nr:maleylacetoacetate isomerase [Pseudohongiella spirulinae]ALO47396.1 Maleylacetoacetate isomerase [Pseudohongiella spirulinae]
MELFSYFRSTAAYRVRIALNLKKIDYRLTSVNLLKNEQKSDEYHAINPMGLIPALRLDDGTVLTQSTAILEWLEETFTDNPLLPADPLQRARIRAITNSIACDIHPLNNLRVLRYLTGELGLSEDTKQTWYNHWIQLGFDALEKQMVPGGYAAGDSISMADVYLVPQVFNAFRFDMAMDAYPKIMAVYRRCNEHAAFIKAHPDNQEDKPVA